MADNQDMWDDPMSGTLVKWDTPKTIEGVYQGVQEVNGKFGLQKQYTIVLRDGTVANFFGTAILDRLMLDPRIEKGTLVQIELTGKTIPTKSGQPAKEFVVRPAKKAVPA